MKPDLSAFAFTRRTKLHDLRRTMARQKGQCTWCGDQVPKGRHSWCSQACVDEYLDVVDPARQRRKVWERDKGVCVRCGVDTERIARLWKRLGHTTHGSLPGAVYNRRVKRFDLFIALMDVWLGRRNGNSWDRWVAPHLWEADHIIPVSEGGGACGLSNLRTLCIPCHKHETAALAARTARARREARQPQLPGM